MKIFRRTPQRHNPWLDAPPWAHELREICLISLEQNIVLTNMVNKLKVQLPPEYQKVMDDIYAQAEAINKKIDDAGVE